MCGKGGAWTITGTRGRGTQLLETSHFSPRPWALPQFLVRGKETLPCQNKASSLEKTLSKNGYDGGHVPQVLIKYWYLWHISHILWWILSGGTGMSEQSFFLSILKLIPKSRDTTGHSMSMIRSCANVLMMRGIPVFLMSKMATAPRIPPKWQAARLTRRPPR